MNHLDQDRLAYFNMAEEGNDQGRAALLRIVQRDPRDEKRQRAANLLKKLQA